MHSALLFQCYSSSTFTFVKYSYYLITKQEGTKWEAACIVSSIRQKVFLLFLTVSPFETVQEDW